MTRLQRTLRKQVEAAIHDFRMFDHQDRLLVGISGGADSLGLLALLLDPSLGIQGPGTLKAVYVDLGFPQEPPRNGEILQDLMKRWNVDFRIIHTRISKTALDPKARKNPCFICSMYRRRKIYETAQKENCNVIAYGHHKDDIIETLLLNILYGRKIESMCPVQEIFRGRMKIIRPLVYADEKNLKKFAQEQNFPDLPDLCPMEGASRRQKIKEIITTLQKKEKNANIRENIFKAHRHVNIDPIFEKIRKR